MDGRVKPGQGDERVRWYMNDVKITVGGGYEEEASNRFIDAWHRAEGDEVFEKAPPA